MAESECHCERARSSSPPGDDGDRTAEIDASSTTAPISRYQELYVAFFGQQPSTYNVPSDHYRNRILFTGRAGGIGWAVNDKCTGDIGVAPDESEDSNRAQQQTRRRRQDNNTTTTAHEVCQQWVMRAEFAALLILQLGVSEYDVALTLFVFRLLRTSKFLQDCDAQYSEAWRSLTYSTQQAKGPATTTTVCCMDSKANVGGTLCWAINNHEACREKIVSASWIWDNPREYLLEAGNLQTVLFGLREDVLADNWILDALVCKGQKDVGASVVSKLEEELRANEDCWSWAAALGARRTLSALRARRGLSSLDDFSLAQIPLSAAVAGNMHDLIASRLRQHCLSSSDDMNVSEEEWRLLDQPPLHIAAWLGHSDTVRLLLDFYRAKRCLKEAVMQVGSPLAMTLLSTACSRGHAAVVRVLLQEPEVERNEGCPLGHAITAKNKEIVSLLMADPLVAPAGPRGVRNPLTFFLDAALSSNSVEMLKMVLDWVDLCAIGLMERSDFLARAITCHSENPEPLDLLLDEKEFCDTVNTPFGSGLAYTPWCVAIEIGSPEVVKKLLGLPQLEVWQNYSSEGNALHLSCARGSASCLALLLSQPNPPLNARCLVTPADESGGVTPLMLAAQNGHVEVVRLLLDYKPRDSLHVNLQDSDGRTAAHYGARGAHLAVLSVLYADGRADFSLRAKDGHTIWDFEHVDREAVLSGGSFDTA